MKKSFLTPLLICCAFVIGSLAQNVTTDRLLLTMGDMLLEKGDPAKAIEQYEKSIAAKPSVEAYNGIGIANSRLGKLPEAAAAYKQDVVALPSGSLGMVEERLMTDEGPSEGLRAVAWF